MNSKQESAMNMGERDIEDAFIQQEDAAVERELAESGEWLNGDIVCRHGHEIGNFIGLNLDGMALVELNKQNAHSYNKSYYAFSIQEISKPLTLEQKAARERELAAIELHDKANAIYFGGELPSNCSWDAAMDNVKAMWLSIVDMTGYRKCQ